MSDNFKNFIENNREQLDSLEPGKELWSGIEKGLEHAAAGAGGASAASAGKAGGLLKLGLGILAAAAVVAGIYFGAKIISPGGKQVPEKNAGPEVVAEGHRLQPKEARGFYESPFEELDVPFWSFELPAKKGGEWTSPTGTRIKVPGRAFEDKEGNKVNGPVTFKYREFHDAADILASGIPMVYYDHQDMPHDFQTAGMMEVRAFQNGEEVFLAEGEELNFEMASFTDEPDHKLYYLDPQEGWKDEGEMEIRKNERDPVALNREKPTKPRKPKKIGESEHSFDFAVEYDDFPELKPFKKINWEYLDVAKVEKNEWIFAVEWNDVKLKEENREAGIYSMVLSKGSKKFETRVTPMLEGKDYEKAMAEFRKKQERFEMLVRQKENEGARLSRQADFVRVFTVPRTGIHNCDRIFGLQGPDILCRVKADVNFDREVYLDKRMTIGYLVTGDGRVLIGCPYEPNGEYMNLQFVPEQTSCLIIVLPDDQVAVYDKEGFDSLTKRQVDSEYKENGIYTFDMKVLEEKVSSVEELRKIMKI